ncbi:hypothetical protein CLIB1444_11S00320 [[Candida] jaroonii]|uniref:Uncharacterized protein n=1 Tax=[Candida] jaroonii TaxID=467808 RepID=A0ACA9YCH1_9ASCO|nr:hypothetical protein CLIB1444_11S00320 [[Candida] jaroonii]
MQRSLDGLLRTQIVGSENFMSYSQSEIDVASSPVEEKSEEYSEVMTEADETTDSQTDIMPSVIKKHVDLGSILNGNKKPKTPSTQKIPDKVLGVNLGSILNGNRQPKPLSPDIDTELADVSNAETIQNLEKEIFKNNKTVNLKDFLGRPKVPEIVNLTSEPDFDEAITPTDSFYDSGNRICIKEMISPKPNSLLVTLSMNKSLLTSFKDKKVQKKKVSAKDLLSKPKESYKITLKVDKDALAFFKKLENPLYSSSNTKYIKSPRYLVTLKIGREPAKLIQQKLQVTKPKKSIFAVMMKNAAVDTVKLTPLQKLKELEAPTLKRNDFLVVDDTKFEHRQLDLTPRHRKYSPEFSESFTYSPIESSTAELASGVETIEFDQRQEMFRNRCNILNPMFSHLYELISAPKDSQLWTHYFEPTTTESLMLSDNNKRRLKDWVFKSFDKLKNQSFKNPRRLKVKAKKRDEFLDFLAPDDDFDDGPDLFLPVLIIQGSTGIGKSASIYTVMKELKGYVHEINASQPRSRRDLLGMLKELCTTHLIHKQDEEGEFQKGIVLLEDCDILFEQDRTFWTVVQEILEISRRPIVLTCSDPDVIPRPIFDYAYDHEAVLDFDHNRPRDPQLFKDYLWGCCLAQGYDVCEDILNSIIDERFDLRQLLMKCQLICQSMAKKPAVRSEPRVASLTEVANSLEAMSIVDDWNNNAYSQLGHSELPNEFIDVYYIDESTQLRQPLASHESTIGDYILEQASKVCDPSISPQKRDQNEIRYTVNSFIGSRSKPMPALLRGLNFSRDRATRSTELSDEFWNSEPVGIPDNSNTIYTSSSTYLTQIAPFARYWNGLQIALDNASKNNIEQGKNIKRILQWREFQDKSNKTFRTLPTAKHFH